MTWTKDKPTRSGWYFYRQPGKNLGKPLSAWVYTQARTVHVSMHAPHDIPQSCPTAQAEDLTGEWWGPLEIPE